MKGICPQGFHNILSGFRVYMFIQLVTKLVVNLLPVHMLIAKLLVNNYKSFKYHNTAYTLRTKGFSGTSNRFFSLSYIENPFWASEKPYS